VIRRSPSRWPAREATQTSDGRPTVLTGSVGLLGDAIHNLSDVSTSAVVFLGFRLSRRPPTEKYPGSLTWITRAAPV
jgi:hypothetical protein